jgi:bacterioferritin
MSATNDRIEHADRIAGRIVELGGNPNFSPDGLSERSHAEYVEADALDDMIRENLVAERIAIESYREIVRYVADGDPTPVRRNSGDRGRARGGSDEPDAGVGLKRRDP